MGIGRSRALRRLRLPGEKIGTSVSMNVTAAALATDANLRRVELAREVLQRDDRSVECAH